MPQCLRPQNIRFKSADGYESFLIPCLKCNFCLQDRRNAWAIRLHQELKRATTAYFLTLTYADRYMPTVTLGDEHERWQRGTYVTLNRKHLTTFHDTLCTANRRFIKSQTFDQDGYKEMLKKYSPKYYSVGEYGRKSARPHYHCIMFNIHPKVIRKMKFRSDYTNDEIPKGTIWNYGHVDIGEVNNASIAYAAKYVIDRDSKMLPLQQKPFSVISKGIGSNYLVNASWHIQPGDAPDDWRIYVMHDGKKLKMPRYYKERIFNEEQRQQFGELGTKHNLQYEAERKRKFIDEYGDIKGHAMWLKQREHEHDLIRIKSQKLNKL